LQSANFIVDQVRKEKEVKVKDLISKLEKHDPESDIFLVENDGRDTHHHRNIRAFAWNGRVQIDGHDPV